jgi:hypothetical protein
MRHRSLTERFPDHFVPTNMPNIYAVKPVAADFNWRNADNLSLKKHGIHTARPEGNSPHRIAAWEYAASLDWHPAKRIIPVFDARPSRARIQGQVNERVLNFSTLPNFWNGIVNDNFNYTPPKDLVITGQWTVPEVSASGQDIGQIHRQPVGVMGWDSSVWIGISGADDLTSSGADLLQAGTQQYVTASDGKAGYLAWAQWFSPSGNFDDNVIPNFLQAGDTIYCTVQYTNDKTQGLVRMNNLNSGQHFEILLDPPAGAGLMGRKVEWILEQRSAMLEEHAAGLPRFGSDLVFTSAIGCGGGIGDVVFPADGTIDSGTGLTSTTSALDQLGNSSITIHVNT